MFCSFTGRLLTYVIFLYIQVHAIICKYIQKYAGQIFSHKVCLEFNQKHKQRTML